MCLCTVVCCSLLLDSTELILYLQSKTDETKAQPLPRQLMLIILLVCRSLEHEQKCNLPLISPRMTNDHDPTPRSVVMLVVRKHVMPKKPKIFFNRTRPMSLVESIEKRTLLTSCKSTLILHLMSKNVSIIVVQGNIPSLL